MKRILINATQEEELRVALVDGQQLYDLDIESSGREQKKGSIYKGKITRVEPSLEAAFVEYGADRHGFLPMKEIARSYFPKDYTFKGRPNIREVLKEGQEVIVQIEKEERGQKGAAITTFISLAGSFLVLMPNNPRAGGISRRIEGEERSNLKEALSQLQIPNGMGVIVRTAGVGRGEQELAWDLQVLLKLWDAIQESTKERPAPFLVHQESNVIIRAIRDHLRADVSEILIDTDSAYQKAIEHIRLIRPDFINKVKLYQDKTVPLFNRYQIEGQIESAFQREVRLPSGGSIVIDPTEALISIDINSAKATKGADIEETAFNTNLEAADEIGRQLRLRDMGGLVVIDFIDMLVTRHQRDVENRINKALSQDRARIQTGRISRFGLLEMSRQRLRPSLGESSQIVCPRCSGHGTIRTVGSLALSVLRLIEEEATKPATSQVRATLPVEVATFLLNEKRSIISQLEKRHKTQILILPNPHMDTPHFEVERLKIDEVTEEASYETVASPQEVYYESPAQQPKGMEKPAISSIPMKADADSLPLKPQEQQKAIKTTSRKTDVKQAGILSRILSSLFGKEEQKEAPAKGQRRSQNRRPAQDKNSRKPRANVNPNRRQEKRDVSKPKSRNESPGQETNRRNVQKAQQGPTRKTENISDKSQQSQSPQNAPQANKNQPRPARKSRDARRTTPIAKSPSTTAIPAQDEVINARPIIVAASTKTTKVRSNAPVKPQASIQTANKKPESVNKDTQDQVSSSQPSVPAKVDAGIKAETKSVKVKPTEKQIPSNVKTVEVNEEPLVDKSITTREESKESKSTRSDESTPNRKTRRVPSHLGGNRYKKTVNQATNLPGQDQPSTPPLPQSVKSAVRSAIVETQIHNMTQQNNEASNKPDKKETAATAPKIAPAPKVGKDEARVKSVDSKPVASEPVTPKPVAPKPVASKPVTTQTDNSQKTTTVSQTAKESKVTKEPQTAPVSQTTSAKAGVTKPAPVQIKATQEAAIKPAAQTSALNENVAETQSSNKPEQPKKSDVVRVKSASASSSAAATKPGFQPKPIVTAYQAKPKKVEAVKTEENKTTPVPKKTDSSFSPPVKPGQ